MTLTDEITQSDALSSRGSETDDGGTICMISTHGYVSAHPELGKPDTGGQVVYVLEKKERRWKGKGRPAAALSSGG